MKNNIKKNTIWNTIGISLNAFNSLFFLIFINRINGVKIAGIFSFAFSIACLLYIVGIYSGRTFQVSDLKGELNDREYLVHKFITCGIMIFFTLAFLGLGNYNVEKSVIIILLCIYKALEAFSDTFYGYLQKNDELHIVGKSLFFKSLVGLILFFIVDIYTKDIILSCAVLVINSLLFVIFYDIRKSVSYICEDVVKIKNVIKLFKIGFSVFVFSFLAVYIVNIPKYVIDMLLYDSSFQTIFGIIVMPGTVMSLCGQYIMAPLLTNIVECYNALDFQKFKKIILRIIKILLFFGLIVEIGAAFLGIPILSIVYAIDLSNYKLDLLLIIFGAILYAIAGILSTALITMRKNNMQLLIYMVDSVIGFIACYIFISIFKIHGATIGYVLTMVLHFLLYTVYFIFEYKKLEVISI